MREFLSADRVATTIRMQRSTFGGSFLVVEGSTDRTFYERFTDKKECRVTTSNGKSNVLQVIEILDRDKFQGVLGIVDADFDRCLDKLPDLSCNLILTDTHDLETLLLQSPALDKVLAEFGSEEKIKAFGKDVRTTLIEASLPIGYLRWISQVDRLNLTFEGIEFKKFINEKTLKINEIDLIKTVQNKSQYRAMQPQEIATRIEHKKSDRIDPWQVCCGHDLVEILSLGLQKAIGTNNSNEVKSDLLELSLRLAYEKAYFIETQIYSAVRTWENCNLSYKVWSSDSRLW